MKELIKKIIRRILGWYIHPLYHEDERMQEKIAEYGLLIQELTEQTKQFTGIQERLDGQDSQMEQSDALVHILEEKLIHNTDIMDGHQAKLEEWSILLRTLQEELQYNISSINEQVQRQVEAQEAQVRSLKEELQCNISSINEQAQRQTETQGHLSQQQSWLERQEAQVQSLKDELLRNTNSMVEQNQQILSIGGQLHEIKSKGAVLESKQAAILYAYRYLLNRDPENESIISSNVLDWQHLRRDFMDSTEYKLITSTTLREMPYYSLTVEGITYFHDKEDLLMPNGMITSGKSWGEADIQNFIRISDQQHYGGAAPQEGLFLDIGGNIGTTSIYCKLKLKPSFRFIAFEPISETAKLLAINAAANGVFSEIKVERIALSNQKQEQAGMQINHENWGNSSLTADGSDGEEQVSVTTLDSYLEEHRIEHAEIKYIWIDVEGHEPEVLEGAASLYRKSKIPTCLEFNQRIYMEHQKYEKMLVLLEKYFDSFIVCEQITGEKDRLRPISELRMLWEECEHKSCDLILM